MEQRTYHGKVTPEDLAEVLLARFNTSDLTARRTGQGDKIVIAIAASGYSGGETSLAVGLSPVSDGVMVTVGEQNILGVAADLVQTGLSALVNPLTLIGEIDDVAKNVDRLALSRKVWEAVDHYCQSVGAGFTPEPTTVKCPYCGVASPVGTAKCASCGAPLADAQPIACPNCGKVLPADLMYCTRCGSPLSPSVQRPPEDKGTPFLARFG